MPTNTPTPTLTLVPTPTPLPVPTKPPPGFLVDLVTTFIGKFHPDPVSMEPLPKWMQPPNLQVTDLEITQVIQCLHNLQCSDNSVPLFSGKLTMVRAYVRIHGGPYSFFGSIGGALCYGNTGAAGCSDPIRPLSKINVWSIDDPVALGRPQLFYTLDFVLPSYMVAGGATKELTAYVNYNFEDLPQEGYYKDNYKSLQYQVEPSEPINIRYHFVQNKGQMANPGSIWDVYDFLDATYPTSQLNFLQGSPLLFKDYAWTEDVKWGCPKGWKDLLSDLWWMRQGTPPIALGIVPSKTLQGGVVGCAYIGSPAASAYDLVPGAGRVAAQEVAHTLNRAHAPGCGAGGADSDFPGLNGGIDETGLDVLRRKVYDPSWVYDYMGYCGGAKNSWTSMYTYEAMAGLLPAGVAYTPTTHLAAPVAVNSAMLVGSGEVGPTRATLLHGFFLLPAGAAIPPTADDGPYSIELLDSRGGVLAARHFAPLVMSDGDSSDSGPFNVSIPWVDGATSAVFRHGEEVIGGVKSSAHAPKVNLISPAGGEAWGSSGSQTLKWSASDTDGNPLQFLLQYSTDGGHTWSVLAPNLTQTSLDIDASFLPGSNDARLRVVASDGFRTATADSLAFTVADKPPQVHISGPTSEDALTAGWPVALHGVASDLEEGLLPDAKLTWTSDRDGPMGTGNTAVVALSEGKHTLTLRAEDSEGMVSTASVQVDVKPAPPEAQEPRSSMPIVLGVIIAGAIGAAAFWVGRRTRRA